MAVSEFLEDLVSHLPALQLLQQIGYQYLTPTEALELRGGRRSRVVLEPILRALEYVALPLALGLFVVLSAFWVRRSRRVRRAV